MRACVCVCVCVCARMCISVCMCVCMHCRQTGTQASTCMYLCLHACMTMYTYNMQQHGCHHDDPLSMVAPHHLQSFVFVHKSTNTGARYCGMFVSKENS